MVTIEQMLKEAIARDASDIFLVAGHPYAFKINGEIHSMQETRPVSYTHLDVYKRQQVDRLK